MPYRSDKQRRFMHAVHPDIAAKWDQEIRDAKLRGTLKVSRHKEQLTEGERARTRRRNRVSAAAAAAVPAAVVGAALPTRQRGVTAGLLALPAAAAGAAVGGRRRVPKERTRLEVDGFGVEKGYSPLLHGKRPGEKARDEEERKPRRMSRPQLAAHLRRQRRRRRAEQVTLPKGKVRRLLRRSREWEKEMWGGPPGSAHRQPVGKASRNVVAGLRRVAPPGRRADLLDRQSAIRGVIATTSGKTKSTAKQVARRMNPNDPRMMYADFRRAAWEEGQAAARRGGLRGDIREAVHGPDGRAPRVQSRRLLDLATSKPPARVARRRSNQQAVRELRLARQTELGKALLSKRPDEALAAQLRYTRLARRSPGRARVDAIGNIRANLGAAGRLSPEQSAAVRAERAKPRRIITGDADMPGKPVSWKGATGMARRLVLVHKAGDPFEVHKAVGLPQPVVGTKEAADESARLVNRRAKQTAKRRVRRLIGDAGGRVHGITQPEVQNRYSAAFL